MNQQSIIKKLVSRRAGGFFSVRVDRPAKVRKGVAEVIRKESTLVCQLADYARRSPVREAVENEERDAPQTPSWVVKQKRAKNGLRFWWHANGTVYLAAPVIQTQEGKWSVNGNPVTLEQIKPHLLASETAARPTKEETEEKGQAQFVCVKLENIAEIA